MGGPISRPGNPNPPLAQPIGGVSPTDILSTLQNAVTAVNALAATYLSVQGKSSTEAISANKLLKAGSGRVASVSVTATDGTNKGAIYDSGVVTNLTNELWVIPAAIGVTFVNMPVDTGIVVAPGGNMTVAVSWS